MSFLDKALEGKIEDAPVIETDAPETPETETPVVDEPVVPEIIVNDPLLEPEPDLVKEEIDYKDWLTNNEDTLFTFLKEKNTDYSKLSQQEVVKRKIKLENPNFDDDDIEGELRDKYGVGLELITVDEDTMTDEQIAEANRHNKEVKSLISKGTRALKTDASKAIEFFEENKGKIELPKFEVERKAIKQDNLFTAEDFIKAQQEDLKVNKEQNWIPTLKQVLEPFEGVTKQVEYEDNGSKVVLDVDYKLSKQEKEEVLVALSDYIQQPADQKYFDAEGNPDLQRFVQDKVAEINLDKLLKTVAKEAAAKARKEFVKNDLINFDDGIRNRGEGNPEEATDRGFFKHAASHTKNKL